MEVLEAKHYTRILEKCVFVYNISVDNNGKPTYFHRLRAADWDISNPERNCKLTVLALSMTSHPDAYKSCLIQLQDDPGGQMFGESNLDFYSADTGCGPSSSLIPVHDSSRYFALEIKKPSGEVDLVGLGFSSRTDSGDLTECLENYLPSQKPFSFKEEVGDPLDIKDVIKSGSQKGSTTRSQSTENPPPEPDPELLTEMNNSQPDDEANTAVDIRPEIGLNDGGQQIYWNLPKVVQQLVAIGEARVFHELDGLLRCHICPFIKVSENGNPKPIIQHWKNEHQLPKSLICESCSIIFLNEALAGQHTELFHQNACPKCPKLFANEIKLQAHMSIVHGQSFQFKCEACSIIFYTREDFRNHASDTQAHHPFVQLIMDPANTPTENIWEFKRREMNSKLVFPSAITAADPLEIEVEKLLAWGVAQRYRDRNSLTGNVLYCLICPVTFEPISGPKGTDTDLLLFNHWERVHRLSSTISFACKTCSLIFSIEAHAFEHREMYHCNKCPHCPTIFPREDSLRMHVWDLHKTNLKYDCQLCGLVFSTRPEFKVHLRSMHWVF